MRDEASLQDLPQLERLLREYTPALRRLAFSYTRDFSEGEDLFQEIAVAFWKALPKFRGESSVRTYIYRVAHNTAMRFVASQRRRSAIEGSAPEGHIEPTSGESPERAAIRSQRRERLWDAVQELPVIDRQIVLLHLEGLSTAEIVDVSGLSEGTVAMRLSRIRRRLAVQLNQAIREDSR